MFSWQVYIREKILFFSRDHFYTLLWSRFALRSFSFIAVCIHILLQTFSVSLHFCITFVGLWVCYISYFSPVFTLLMIYTFKYKKVSPKLNITTLITFLILIKGIKYATDIMWRDLCVNIIEISGLTCWSFSGREVQYHIEGLLFRPVLYLFLFLLKKNSRLPEKNISLLFLADKDCYILVWGNIQWMDSSFCSKGLLMDYCCN